MVRAVLVPTILTVGMGLIMGETITPIIYSDGDGIIRRSFENFAKKHKDFFNEFRSKRQKQEDLDVLHKDVNQPEINNLFGGTNPPQPPRFDKNPGSKGKRFMTKLKQLKKQKPNETLRRVAMMISKLLFQLSKIKE